MKNKVCLKEALFIKLLKKVSKIAPFHFWSIYIAFILSGIMNGVVIKVKQLVFDGAVLYVSGDKGHKYMFTVLLLLFMCEILNIILNYGGNFLGENYDIKATSVLKKEVHAKIDRIPNIYFEDNKILDNIEKSYEGISMAIAFINSIMDMFFMYLPIIVVFAVYLFSIKPILILILLFIFTPIMYAQFIKAKIHGKLEQQIAPLRRKSRYYANAAVGKEGFKETRILGCFSYLRRLFNDTLYTMQQLRVKAEIKNNIYELSARLMSLLGYLGILFILFTLLMKKEISVGMFAAIFSSIDEMYGIIEEAIVSRLGNYAMNYGKINNYFEFMNLQEEARSGDNDINGSIQLKNVSFRYPNTNINAIENINLELRPGEKIAIIGKNGCGKTTLSKVLTGIYKPTSGNIKWNGYCKDEVSFDHISYVFQDYQKYKMSLLENVWISHSEKEDIEEGVWKALDNAGVDVDIKTYPNKLQTMLSKEYDGVDVSGGQWQKIAIARGFYRNSNFIVLDEPTSAIDPIEEEDIYRRFEKLIADKTAVIITHRLGAIRFVNKILVMDNGKVVGFGDHEYLLNNNEVYRTMWSLQASQYLEGKTEN